MNNNCKAIVMGEWLSDRVFNCRSKGPQFHSRGPFSVKLQIIILLMGLSYESSVWKMFSKSEYKAKEKHT